MAALQAPFCGNDLVLIVGARGGLGEGLLKSEALREESVEGKRARKRGDALVLSIDVAGMCVWVVDSAFLTHSSRDAKAVLLAF